MATLKGIGGGDCAILYCVHTVIVEVAPNTWQVSVTLTAASRQEALTLESRVRSAIESPFDSRHYVYPSVTSEMRAQQQLRVCIEFAQRHKRAPDSTGLYAVLVAMRTGVITRDANRWSGGVEVVRAAKGEISQGEVSKAATVIQGAVGHLLDRNLPVESAIEQLGAWLFDNDWQVVYDQLKAPRTT